MGLMGPMRAMDSVGAMGGMFGGYGMMGQGVGSSEVMFREALQLTIAGQCTSQMSLLLQAELLFKALVPYGHLADIAQKCGIRIDLGAEIPPDTCQVVFTGSVVANAMAAYFLQERALQCTGGAPA